MSATPEDRRPLRRKRLRSLIIGVLTVCLLVVLIRSRVGEIYHVRENSMHPVLLGGEDSILVLYATDPAESDRFEPWVFRDQESGGLRIKRVVGLGGEVVDLIAGDIFVGPDRDALTRALRARPIVERQRIPVFHSRAGAGTSRLKRTSGRLAVSSQGELQLEGQVGAALAAVLVGRLMERPDVYDDSVDALGKELAGEHCVTDLRIEYEIKSLPAGGWLRVTHELAGEDRQVLVSRESLEVSMTVAGGSRTVQASVDAPAFPLRVRMETLDGEFSMDSRQADGDWQSLVSGPRDTRRHAGRSRVRIESGRGVVELAFLDIDRDVHYFWPPALGEAHKVRADGIFLLGDNPGSSQDSREDDDVPRSALVGRAAAIVWPPDRWRFLGH